VPQPEWSELSVEDLAAKMARQGVGTIAIDEVRVADPATGKAVEADGKNQGEKQLRGNTLMKGYLKNPETTARAFADGWLSTDDLAVMHPDHYVEIKDRSKDIIISGGENISSLEVEEVLYQHPAVSEAVVIAIADEKWGEVPCAFINLVKNHEAPTEADVMAFCKERMARFKVPKKVIFGELPKTATGKIRKNVLRDKFRDE
jgi:fatty-acyl-CoA synthase